MISLSSEFYSNKELCEKSVAITSDDRVHDEKIILEIAKREQNSYLKVAKIFDCKKHLLNMKLIFSDKMHKENFVKAISSCKELVFDDKTSKIPHGIIITKETLKKVK